MVLLHGADNSVAAPLVLILCGGHSYLGICVYKGLSSVPRPKSTVGTYVNLSITKDVSIVELQLSPVIYKISPAAL